MNDEQARARLLTEAGRLFYARGTHSVGMDDVRTASGLPLKRIYRYFPSKDDLVRAYLTRRDDEWLAALARRVGRCPDPGERLLAVFAFLGEWFTEPGFHGCAFINAFGELGGGPGGTAEITKRHKQRLLQYLTGLAAEADAARPAALAAQLLMLVDGAVVSAATGVNPRAAADAETAARILLGSHVSWPPRSPGSADHTGTPAALPPERVRGRLRVRGSSREPREAG